MSTCLLHIWLNLFLVLGESYPELEVEDFALGFMTKNMERKILNFSRIICIDGTHGTNARNWDLTIVLVKDENNLGFPVAFLISNRLDQTIQSIFFRSSWSRIGEEIYPEYIFSRSLRRRIGEDINAEYIMTDDDVKYYNAWCQAMTTDVKPRRLLCTWHVIKNWNIRGKSKIKNMENKTNMKEKMRRILKETNIGKFHELKEEYFKLLKEQNECEFLNYLQKLVTITQTQ